MTIYNKTAAKEQGITKGTSVKVGKNKYFQINKHPLVTCHYGSKNIEVYGVIGSCLIPMSEHSRPLLCKPNTIYIRKFPLLVSIFSLYS